MADCIADFRFLLVLLGQLHTQKGVREIRILFRYLSYIVQEAGPLCNLGVEAKLTGHDGADVCHLTGVLEEVLAVG